MRLSKPKPHAQSHRASQRQSLACIQDSSHCSAVHGPSTQCWGAVFIQVDRGGGPGSHCGPCISWGGHSELLDSLGERTRIYSEIPAKSKPILVILSDTITEHQGLDSITLG